MKISREEAVTLRLQGLTYKQIAGKLKCSVRWCEVNLKGVEKPTCPLLEEVIKCGLSEDGVTNSQIRMWVDEAHPEATKEQKESTMKSLKWKAKQKANIVIRPGWMKPKEAKLCLKTMLEYANELYEEKDRLAWSYIQKMGLSKECFNVVRRELNELSSPMTAIVPEGVMNRCERYSVIAGKLQERN